MTRAEQQDLLKICRMRTRIAMSEADAVAARRKAEFAAQLAAKYSFDDDAVWKQATAIAKATVEQAQEQIATRAAELGIPRRFAPSLHMGWISRGENACAQRRAELTKVAHTHIEQLRKEARHAIEGASADIQTRLVAAGLESADARAWLESIPAAEALMPQVTVADASRLLRPAEDGAEGEPIDAL